MDVEAANRAARGCALGKTIQSILDDLKPEAAYFASYDGEHTAFLSLEIKDASQMSAIAEPWLLAFKAKIELHPARYSGHGEGGCRYW